METGFWSNVARGLFAAIDRALYGLDSILYEILNTIVNEVHLFSNETIDTFAVRVYTFLGLIMVFKVTFSLINYLVNPDLISDKTNGAGNVAKNIVITLFLIILTPYAFDFLYRAQSAIISDQLVAKVILGDVNTDKAGMKVRMSPGCGNDVAQTSDMGEFIALMTLRPFYQMEEGSIEDGVKTQYCLGGQDGEKIKNLLGSDIYKASKNKIYSINYSFLLSTGAGVVVLLMLLTACMEIALRAIKLGFLEIIAPIPILSYIDPKSGKDGIFKKWLKEVGKTWASLFVRLAAIYFAIYIISLIDEATENISNQNLGIWVSLFILIGALMFAKQFPKLIEDIFGIKLDMLSLHPIKKIQDEAAGGKALLGLGAAGAALGLGAATNAIQRSGETFNNVRNAEGLRNKAGALFGGALRTAGSTIAGGASAGFNAFQKTRKDGNVLGGMWSGYQTSMFSKLQREDTLRKAGLENAGLGERIAFGAGSIGADLHRFTGTLNRGQQEYLTAAQQDRDLQEMQSRLSADKRALAEEKREQLEPYSMYSNYAQAIKAKVESQRDVKAAQEYKDNINSQQFDTEEAYNEAIKRANDRLDAAKTKAYEKLIESDSNVQDLVGRMENIRNNNDILRDKKFDIYTTDAAGNHKFSAGKVIGMAQGEADRIGRTFTDREEQFKVREEQIEAFKSSEAYETAHSENSPAKLQNASRTNRDGQKPGFKPSPGPIQGTAGDSYTSGRFGGMSGPNGSGGHPPNH